ncbi:AraC family transcriptional regulator [Hyphococcus sp.]|uniref:AraC family transcriptional regulator n=1 Tax=Hyphococcus sp. TaxID=2038636 RepID=UPI002081CB0B|nr:MAG: AraC family transcriptional regulator [Marinicaulis sp.]
MSRLYRQASLHAPLNDVVEALVGRVVQKLRNTEPYVLMWWVFTACVSASQIGRYFGETLGPLTYLITIAGSAGCGWIWLLSRSLFRSRQPEPWALLTVGAIVIVESYWHFTSNLPGGGLTGEMRRIGENAAALVCFSAIAMVFVEALSGFNAQLPKTERRFRQIFVSVFAAIIVISLVWAGNADKMSIASNWSEATLAGCAMFAVVASRLAVNFRRHRPLHARASRITRDVADNSALAQRILQIVENRELFTTPNLKIAQFAEALGEQEYKVTQCITGNLQYRNFNHFINSYRIESAKRALASAQSQDQPILTIAFDCGFSSLGPFNRAFKQHAGMTPREFRAAHGGQRQRFEEC